jgi:hypothetical protein
MLKELKRVRKARRLALESGSSQALVLIRYTTLSQCLKDTKDHVP